QALAAFFTLWERGVDSGAIRLAWIGDGNNVCHSVILLGALLGASTIVACPPGYEPAPRVLDAARRLGGRVEVTEDARKAAAGADVIYTDVWTSMGQEAERARRQEAFSRYQDNETIEGFAKPSARGRSSCRSARRRAGPARRPCTSWTCARSSSATSFSRCSAAMRCTRARTSSAPRSRVRSSRVPR